MGLKHKGFWCVPDIDNPFVWRLLELYLFLVILVLPTGVMTFSYGRIIAEVSQVVRQRELMTATSSSSHSNKEKAAKKVSKQQRRQEEKKNKKR